MIWTLIVCISYDKLCIFTCMTLGVTDSNVLCLKISGEKTLGGKDGELSLTAPHHCETLSPVGALSSPTAGRRTCCISWRGSDGRAREAQGLPAPPPLRCGSRSWCSCGAWPPVGSCLAAAWSHRAGCWESPRRSELRETPPEGGGDGGVTSQFSLWQFGALTGSIRCISATPKAATYFSWHF